MKGKLEHIICALNECEGDKNECWRKTDGFWGKVALKCGHANTDYIRKALYMVWYRDTDNIKEKFANSVPPKSKENLDEVRLRFKHCLY